MLLKALVLFLGLFFISPQGLLAYKTKNINYSSSLQIIAQSISEKIGDDKDKKILVFEGKVHFEVMGIVKIFSDKLLVGFTKDGQGKYFQLKGNVIMQKGELRISSQAGYTNNLHAHIDFIGETVISRKGVTTNSMNIRYDFFTDTFLSVLTK